MRVLVTGFAGYIGPVVVRRLKAAGHKVDGLDAGWFLPQYASVPAWPDRAEFGDIIDGTSSDPDVLVHLAGLSNDPLGALNPDLTNRINKIGTLDMIAQSFRVRHVVVSSCAVYGSNDTTVDEETAPNPLTAYARAKASVDIQASHIARNLVSLRLGTVYGPSPGHRLDLVVNRMVYDAVHGKGVTVSGSSWRPFTHVEDVAEAVLRAVEGDFVGIRNVVGQNMRIDTLGKVVANTIGSGYVVRDSPDARDYRATTLYPEWMEYRHSIEGSIFELAEFSLSLPGLPSRYERLVTIKQLIASGRLTADLKEPIAA